MPLDNYPFSERYGWVRDRFGVSWQLILSESEQKFVPSLLFVDKVAGKAEEAMNYYMSKFENTKVVMVQKYGPEDKDPEGSVMYARFTLAGKDFVVMDSHGDHKFAFSPAVSFMVYCDTQGEIDKFWKELSEGGEEGQCGWLQDKYGVSWQIVPAQLGSLVSGSTPERTERVMGAVIQMKKLDIAQLTEAAEQVKS